MMCLLFSLLLTSTCAAWAPKTQKVTALSGNRFAQTPSILYCSSRDDILLSLDDCRQLFGSNSNVRFVDGTWFHKGDRNGRQEFINGPRIKESIYFDLDDICNHSSHLSHMLPESTLLQAWLNHHNISKSSDRVIVYGREGCHFLPRVWFTLNELVDRVSIMEASLEEWMEDGGPVDDKSTGMVVKRSELSVLQSPEPASRSNVVDLHTMTLLIEEQKEDTVILDARGSSFAKYGHMPGAIHIPYSTLTERESSLRFKSTKELVKVLREAGFDPQTEKKRTIVCTCGSGVSACSVYLTLRLIGCDQDDILMYDGSWQEWGSISELPKVRHE